MHYLGKFEVSQHYGGSEEGGRYYDSGYPVWKFGIPMPDKPIFWRVYRWLNGKERKRQEQENKYGYTSVLSYRDNFYSYQQSDSFKLRPFPAERPHYE